MNNFDYRVVIDIRKDTPKENLIVLAELANKAFDNRAGKISNTSDTPYRLIYVGGDSEYACLEVGMLNLKKQPDFLRYLEAWDWIDENDPEESTDLLKLFTKNCEVNLWL